MRRFFKVKFDWCKHHKNAAKLHKTRATGTDQVSNVQRSAPQSAFHTEPSRHQLLKDTSKWNDRFAHSRDFKVREASLKRWW